jgi:hypothetical protein
VNLSTATSCLILVLSLPTSVSLTLPFHAKPECLRHLAAAYRQTANALTVSFLLLLASGEVFNDISARERRLRGYGPAEGFGVVQTGGRTREHSGARWQCGYHGVEAKN